MSKLLKDKTKSSKRPTSEVKRSHHKKRPAQQALPGMEDRGIPDLERAACNYVDVRDERMELTKQESAHKTIVLGLMKKHGKDTYRNNGMEITVVSIDETVKVKMIEKDTEKGDKVAKKKAKGAKKTKPEPQPEPEEEAASGEEEHPENRPVSTETARAAEA